MEAIVEIDISGNPFIGFYGGRVTLAASLGATEAAFVFFYLAFFHPEIKHGSGGIGGYPEMKANIVQRR